MQNTLSLTPSVRRDLVLSLAGSLFIGFCSLIWIPTLPIAITLQTLALFILALTLSPKVCFLSAIFYLVEATMGLPVLGRVNPLWFVGPSAGYLIAFPVAAYLMARIAYQSDSLLRQCAALLAGLALIYASGFALLSTFIGASAAWQYGVLYFAYIDLIKIGLAITLVRGLSHLRSHP